MAKVVKSRDPVAFFSYVRMVDQHEGGRLTEIRKRLSREVEVQTGEAFPIFQDRNDIQWGQQWQERIDDSLDDVTFLIPIITPSFFASPACRDELEKFIEREEALKRNDLILPIYYVDCPVLNDEDKRKADPLAEVIASRQYFDWRDLRFEPMTSPQIGKKLAEMSVQIRDALERTAPRRKAAEPRAPIARAGRGKVKTSAARDDLVGATAPVEELSQAETDREQKRRGPVSKSEPPTHVVDPMAREDFTTISDALAAANPGDRILVRPGLYEEGLVIDKPIEIIGDGEVDEIVIRASGKDCILFEANMGRVVNLTLQQMGDGDWYGVDIAQGRLELEDCDITSQSLSCVAIHAGADPRLRRNRIHDGKACGVFVYDEGQGTLEDNDIFGNALAGTLIKEGGNPTLRRNKINNSGYEGIWVYDNGGGTFEDNDLTGNTQGAWDISKDSKKNVKRSGNKE